MQKFKNWQFIVRTLFETNNENYFPGIIDLLWPLFSYSHWKLLSLTYHLCPQNHVFLFFFALLSDHDAFGIIIFPQRNGKWFLRPKQRGLNSVDLFIKEPLFLPLTTADCAEETEKSRSRQCWAKNNNFSKHIFSLIVVGNSLRLCTCQILICPHPVKMKGIGKNSPLFRVLKTWKQRYVGIAYLWMIWYKVSRGGL